MPIPGVSKSLTRSVAHVPFQVVGEHAEKDMRAHAIGEPVIDRPHVQINGLDAAEGALDLAERFVAAYGCRIVQHVGRQAGAHYIYCLLYTSPSPRDS